MPLNKIQLKDFKLILDKRAKEIKKELADFAHKNKRAKGSFVTEIPDFGNKDDENAREVAAYIDRLSLKGTLEKELQDIIESLKRIKAGVYGICKYCKKDIGQARLKIRPTSSSCVACKKRFKGEK